MSISSQFILVFFKVAVMVKMNFFIYMHWVPVVSVYVNVTM
jgi:hypothetical protein